MLRFPPFLEHGRDEAVRTNSHIRGSNDEIVGTGIGDVLLLVTVEPYGLVMPLLHEPTDALLNEVRQITNNIPGVFAGQLDFPREAEVVANEHGRTGDNTRWKRLVMGIPKSQHEAIIVVAFGVVDFHEAEVPLAFMTQAVGECAYGEVVGFDGVLHLGDEVYVWDRCPRFGGPRRSHLLHITAISNVCAAVKNEVGMMPLTRRFE